MILTYDARREAVVDLSGAHLPIVVKNMGRHGLGGWGLPTSSDSAGKTQESDFHLRSRADNVQALDIVEVSDEEPKDGIGEVPSEGGGQRMQARPDRSGRGAVASPRRGRRGLPRKWSRRRCRW